MTRNIFSTLPILLLFGFEARAGPITPSKEGCDSNRDDTSWTSEDPTGFQFMAFWDEGAGCDPTIRTPTGGFFTASVTASGGYRIDVPAGLLPPCGRVQFDAHAYSASGLDMGPGGLKSFVFNSQVDCVTADNKPGTTQRAARDNGGTENPVAPAGSPTQNSTQNPTPVPEPASMLLLGMGLLAAARWARKH